MTLTVSETATPPAEPAARSIKLGTLRDLRKSPSHSGCAEQAAALSLLTRAETGLLEANGHTTATARYVGAHMTALRAAAAVLAVRGRPRRGAGVLNTWAVLPKVAPELAQWCPIFEASAPIRHALETGARADVPDHMAEQLLVDAERFVEAIGHLLDA